jgi:hypothetical protein
VESPAVSKRINGAMSTNASLPQSKSEFKGEIGENFLNGQEFGAGPWNKYLA